MQKRGESMNDINLLLKVAELYYFKKWTQQKIADEIGVSRASISRLLDEARERGIVEIRLKSVNNRNIELESLLKAKFELKDAIVFESIGNYKYDLGTLGEVSSKYFSDILEDGYSVGISWGQSVQSLVNSFPETSFRDTIVTQVNGGLKGNTNTRYIADLVLSLGKKLNATCHLLEAPAYVSSQGLKDELLSQPQIQESFSEMNKLDVVITGVGDLNVNHNTLYSTGNILDKDIKTLVSKNVVGHILGRMFDSKGKEVKLDNKHAIAMKLDTLVQTPNRIGAVINESRKDATKVAIEANFINILICDDSLAKALLID